MMRQKKSIRASQRKERDAKIRGIHASHRLAPGRCIVRNLRISPRKVRLVLDMVRSSPVDVAMSHLKFNPNGSSGYVLKGLMSAIANWQALNAVESLSETPLFIVEARAGEGVPLKRMRPASRGRGHPFLRRSSHVYLTVNRNVGDGERKELDLELRAVDAGTGTPVTVKGSRYRYSR